MNPRILLALSVLVVALLVFVGLAYGGDSPRAKANAADDIQDFVFFAQERPLLVRAHVRVDGKSYRTIWDDYVTKVFKFLDTDGDGVLSQKELDSMPPMQFLTGNGVFAGRLAPAPGRTDRPTPNKDGKVTREELGAFLRKSGAAAFQFQMGRSSGGVYGARVINLDSREPVSSEALNDAIFALLDTNKDGRLSREELLAAPALFATRDVNDDEMITPQELLRNSGKSGIYGVAVQDAATVVVTRNSPTTPSVANSPVMLINPGESGATLARQLLARYGSKGRKKLTANTLGMDKATFDRLDADKDGELDTEELAQFAKRPPDLEVTFRIGSKDDGEKEIDGKLLATGPTAPKLSNAGGAVNIELGVTQIEMKGAAASSSMGTNFKFRLRDQYVNFFKMADTDNNGYLDEKEAKASPLFRDVFKAMDTDGDGMLYEKEMVAYLDKVEEIQKAVRTGCVTLALTDTGNGLFDMLDRDHDGRLSVRELRGAVDLLKTLDRDGDGFIARSEIPHKFEMRVSQGPADNGTNSNNVVVVKATAFGSGDSPAPSKGKGPLWFRKMDTNRDGDLSRREFLGSDEDFKRIDRDGDGLISAEEAEAFDKETRKVATQKK